MILEWSDDLATGVEVIDTDHKVLVEQINMLADAVEKGNDHSMTSSVLNVLIDYTAFHFGREQALMEETSYGDAEAHLREHRLLVKKVRDIQAGFNNGTALGKDVLNFLRVWLTQHILKSDKAFGAHLVAAGAARRVPPMHREGPVDWSKISVLVVDDQFNFRALLRSSLAAMGVTNVREARSGQEALDMLTEMPMDVVLVDDEMKPMDGLEFTRRLRCSTGTPDPRTVTILLASSEITRDTLAAATRVGVHDVIVKPLAGASIRSRIERHLSQPLPFHQVGAMLMPIRPKATPKATPPGAPQSPSHPQQAMA